MKFTYSVFDGQQGKTLNIAPKLALRLTSCYPKRFTLVVVTARIQKKEVETMSPFQMPEKVNALTNGTHILTVVQTKTVISSRFNNEQEEVTCIEDATGELTRLWISHTRKAVDEAISVGLMEVLPDENVQVVIGCKFQVVIVNGKKVALLKVETPKQPA